MKNIICLLLFISLPIFAQDTKEKERYVDKINQTLQLPALLKRQEQQLRTLLEEENKILIKSIEQEGITLSSEQKNKIQGILDDYSRPMLEKFSPKKMLKVYNNSFKHSSNVVALKSYVDYLDTDSGQQIAASTYSASLALYEYVFESQLQFSKGNGLDEAMKKIGVVLTQH